MRKWFLNAMTFILISVLLLAGCASDSNKPAQGDAKSVKQEITMNALSEPPAIDPALATDTTSGWILDHLFEGLYTKDKNGDVVLGTAKDVKVSDDKTKYTITIRDDAKWSNGDPVKAEDYAYAWNRVLNPETGSAFAFHLYYIKGAEEYNKGTGKLENVGIRVIDEKTLEVELKAPLGFFDKLLAFWTYYPVNKSVVEGNKNWAAEANTLVSNGAYTMTEWKHNSNLIIEKNKNYWNKKDVSMEKVTWKMVVDATTYYQMYKTEELDLIQTLPTDAIEQEKQNKEFKNVPYFGTYMYMFNVKKEPFTNEKVRRAFALAIDREALTKNISKGGEKPAYSFVPSGVKEPSGKDYREVKPGYFKYDPAEGKKLLEEAMKEEGWSKLPEVTLMYNTAETHKKMAEAVQQMLNKNLNINVQIANQEWKTYLETTNQHNFQMARMGWVGVYEDPIPVLDYYLGDSPNNRTQWVNEEYDSLLKQAKVEQDDAKRFELMHKAEDVLMKDLPFIPIYHYSNNYLTSSKYKDIVYPVNRFPYVRWATKTSN
ncbi:ABC transporter substrate-binding protein [Neobacillus sp. NPDC058068]|uniref:peptide ABC transporter substrate-binding protein n=1 Tax=Neobacillus sp. NPDC058068 TaxID=3346325 RepID=UPI0036D9318C